MDREQKKVLEKCNRLIEPEYFNWIGTVNQKAIEKVLNMLKEKDIQNKIIDLMLDDLNVNGYPKEELYNSYKHRADAILKEE